MPREIQFNVNGRDVSVVTDEIRPLLDVLREDLGLTGTKFGCGEGQCGACTVLLGGIAIRSCVTDIADVDGEEIETIEGLAQDDRLHPVQQAFIEKQAMQCGYCVPGQIMSAVALLREKPQASRDEIIQGIKGNICRCCNYPNIQAAVERAAGQA